MEALLRAVYNLSGHAFEKLDKTWIKATEAFFTVFLIVLVGVPVLAHFGWTFMIFVVMLVFFMVWIVATFRIRNIAAVAAAGLTYGVPAEGNASPYAWKMLATLSKVSFLVLICGEAWMATYLHFPSFAKEWWMIGSAVGIMLVVIPTVIYALATEHMLEGPWHKPVLAIAIVLLAVVMFSAIPTSVWTSVGINTLSFQIPETTERAQAIRSKSYDNLVGKKLKEMQTLQQKVEKGEVLTTDELQKLESLETEAKAVPAVPTHPIVKAVNDQLPKQASDITTKQIVFGLAALLLVVWLIRGRKNTGPFWLAVLLLVGYFALHSDALRDFGNQVEANQAMAKQAEDALPRTHFIAEADWGRVGARKIAPDDLAAGDITPLFRIEKGQYTGKRPVPLLGMNGGQSITLLIEPDVSDEQKDIIIEQQMECPNAEIDGVWSCTTSWRSRGDARAKGSALLYAQGGVRTVTLYNQDGQQVISFQIERI